MVAADIAAIVDIEDETLSSWRETSLAAEIQAPYGCQFVAELHSGIAGWCCCRRIAPEAELLKISVKKACRRQGVASSLLDRLIKELRRQKVETLFLEVRAANREAKSFYQQHGFSQVGVRRGYYASPPDNALIFCKSIL